jgi:hypothetical protein
VTNLGFIAPAIAIASRSRLFSTLNGKKEKMKKILFAAVVGGLVAAPALAAEKSMGETLEKNGMEIGGV